MGAAQLDGLWVNGENGTELENSVVSIRASQGAELVTNER